MCAANLTRLYKWMAMQSTQSECVCDQCLPQTAAGWLPALMAISQSDGWKNSKGSVGEKQQGGWLGGMGSQSRGTVYQGWMREGTQGNRGMK